MQLLRTIVSHSLGVMIWGNYRLLHVPRESAPWNIKSEEIQEHPPSDGEALPPQGLAYSPGRADL